MSTVIPTDRFHTRHERTTAILAGKSTAFGGENITSSLRLDKIRKRGFKSETERAKFEGEKGAWALNSRFHYVISKARAITRLGLGLEGIYRSLVLYALIFQDETMLGMSRASLRARLLYL